MRTVGVGKMCRRDATTNAVLPDLTIGASPVCNHVPRLWKRSEPVLVEALVAEIAVEAFDVGALSWGTRPDQDVVDAMSLRPGNEDATGELRAIVGASRAWIATKHAA